MVGCAALKNEVRMLTQWPVCLLHNNSSCRESLHIQYVFVLVFSNMYLFLFLLCNRSTDEPEPKDFFQQAVNQNVEGHL
jgi:hypothetical protein